MKTKGIAKFFLLTLAFMAVVGVFSMADVANIGTVYAEGMEDDIGGDAAGGNEGNDGVGGILDGIKDQEINEKDQGISDWLSNQGGLSSDQLNVASDVLSPVTNIIGYITGGIVVLTVAGVIMITALDLLYMAFPPLRNILYKQGTDGTGAAMNGTMPAGGVPQKRPTQFVSDEAVACAALLGGAAQSPYGAAPGGAMPMGAGMAYGHRGMMGGGVMGMPGQIAQGSQPAQQRTMRSVIGLYFRKRLFFMILLAICIIVLTSSTLMNCGVNLAEWVLKIGEMFNTQAAA